MAAAKESRRPDWPQAGPEAQLLLRKGLVVFRHARAWEPPTDVYENEQGLVIQVEIAGMSQDDLNISVRDRTLVMEGVRRDPEPKQAYHQMEIVYGEFRSEVCLPWPVEVEEVKATYKDGFLRVEMPRPQARRVEVKQGGEQE